MMISEEELERKAAELRARLSEAELGYLVGLVEGEAGLGIHSDKRVGREYPRISISNTNQKILNHFQTKLKIGKIYHEKGKANHKDWYVWDIYGREALIFLRALLAKFFSCKRTKGALLLALNINNKGTFAQKIKERVEYLNNNEENIFLDKAGTSEFYFRNNITDFDLGVLAGLLDSEGSVVINNGAGALIVGINSTCPRIIYKILSLAAGWSLTVVRRPPYRAKFTAYLYNRKAALFLNRIKNFLIIKRAQAELGLEYIKTLSQRGRHIPPEVKKRRTELYWRLRALNVRGRIFSCGSVISFQPFSPRPPSLKWNFPRSLLSLDV